MGLMAKTTGSNDFDPIKQGVHYGVCFAIYDLGTTFNDRFGKSAHKIIMMWEVQDERMEIKGDDLPRAISKQYTLSLHEKANLRRDLEIIRGQPFTESELEGFDLKNVLGHTCQLQILHTKKDGKTYANVASVMGLAPGTSPLKPENPLKWFSLEEDADIPDSVPEWVAKLIQESDEWKGSQAKEHGEVPPAEEVDMGDDEPEDLDLPF